MPAASSMVACISVRIAATVVVATAPVPIRSRSIRRTSSAAWAATTDGVGGGAGGVLRGGPPARAPKTRHSGSELEPSRLAPLMLTHAVSPAAYRPASGVAPSMSVGTPPIM